MKVEVKELKISNELQRKIAMICRFVGVSSTLTSEDKFFLKQEVKEKITSFLDSVSRTNK